MEGGKPSQSKSSILPALPKGEPSVVLFIYVLQQKPLPEGEPSVVLFIYVFTQKTLHHLHDEEFYFTFF